MKKWLIAILTVMLLVASWQYWQIRQQAPVQATESGYCGGFNNEDSCKKCGWAWEGSCCPPDRLACKDREIGEFKCTNKPQIRECTFYSNYCSNKNFWKLVDIYSTVEEICKDKRCKDEDFCKKPKVSPTPNPSPSPQTGKIRVRKWYDRNKNGVKDWNEAATGRAWPFQYRINGGAWQDYSTNAFTGVGAAITVPANSQVRVWEITLAGWANSTPLVRIESVTAGELQWFEFGNYRVSGPLPSPSVSPSPSPLSSPGTDEASFVVRKFQDDNKDGDWDDNETSTGRDWSFQYRFNDGDWRDYTAWGDSGWGGIVTVGRGTKAEVREIEQDGWTNTTGLTLIKILEENKVYYFDFGNFRSPEVVETEPPAEVPQAGSGLPFRPWLVVVGLGLGLQLLALWL